MTTTRIRPPLRPLAHAATVLVKRIALASVLLACASAGAQTQLRPPSNAVQPQSNPAPVLMPQRPVTAIPPTSRMRLQSVIVDGRAVDISTLPDATLLKGSSGRTISVARVKQLQARLERGSTASSAGGSRAPLVVAKPGQSLASLTQSPAGTRIQLPGGRVARVEDLSKIQQLRAKLNERRVVRTVPQSMDRATANAVLGQNGLTMAEALKRPGSDVIQVGQRKFSVDQLRQMDALLRASPREPRGLTDRIATSTPGATNAATARLNPGSQRPSGPVFQVRRGMSLRDMLAKPDNTVLQTESGKTTTVAQIKQYMATQRLNADQLEQKMKVTK